MIAESEYGSLIQEFPLGFYNCNLEKFEDNYRELLAAFTIHYPDTQIAYSYKTNYLPSFCRKIDALGGYAEVVSGLEFDIARQLGVDGSQIIFNGPVKFEHDLVDAARCGALVNIESESEIEKVEYLSQKIPDLSIRVGLRCSVPVNGVNSSRFGIEIHSNKFAEAVERLHRIRCVSFEGLHCHSLPPFRTAESYGQIARSLAELAQMIWGSGGPAFLDVGGGFYSKMPLELSSQFESEIPTFMEYGKAITSAVLESFPNRKRPTLILEPGLALAADTISFVCRIHDVKKVGNKNVAVATGSVYNIKPNKSPRDLPLRVISRISPRTGRSEEWVIVGHTCMEDDVLHRNFQGQLATGDLLEFLNVGAYTLVLKPPFIQGNAPIFSRDEHGEIVMLKRPEISRDFLSTYTDI